MEVVEGFVSVSVSAGSSPSEPDAVVSGGWLVVDEVTIVDPGTTSGRSLEAHAVANTERVSVANRSRTRRCMGLDPTDLPARPVGRRFASLGRCRSRSAALRPAACSSTGMAESS